MLVVGDVDRAAVHAAATRAEQRLGRAVDVTMRSQDAWHDDDDAFLAFVRQRPLVRVLPVDGLSCLELVDLILDAAEGLARSKQLGPFV